MAMPVFATLGCGADFDTPDEVKSLRVLAIQKDHPYAAPTLDPSNPSLVQMTMLWHDGLPTPGDEPRDIQRLWFSGSENLPGDQYFSGMARIYALWQVWSARHTIEELQDGASWSPVDDLPPTPEARNAELAFLLQQVGSPVPIDLAESYFSTYRIGLGDRFTYPIPPRIIENHRSSDPEIPPYGLAFVFFTACAGHIDVAPEWQNLNFGSTLRDATLGFPFLCLDGTGTPLDSDSYVAGYTQQFVYGDGSANLNPVIDSVNWNGTPVDFCRDGDCVPEAEYASCEDPDKPLAHARACKDHCPTYDLKPVLKPEDNDDVDTFTSASGNPVSEQMWIDYYSSGGEFDGAARALRDTTLGWFDDYGQKWKAPPDVGPVWLWAVVHDNRGGAAWVRLQVCVD
jgi:hypothetical protein